MKVIIIKKLFLFIFSLLLFAKLNAQENSFNYSAQLGQRASVPKSPEAFAFSRYGDIAVNLYAGQPDISVPIYTHKGIELDLPLSLTYDARGIGVNQNPTTVGLGWNFKAGGLISRRVNGLPDDYIWITGPYDSWYSTSIKSKITAYSGNSYKFSEGHGGSATFSTHQSAVNYLKFLEDVSVQAIEAQPDIYTVNAPGLSLDFILSMSNNKPFSLNNPNVKISKVTGSTNSASDGGVVEFKIISDNGTTYYFQSVEKTLLVRPNDFGGTEGNQNIYAGHVRYTSAWYLTKMVSPNRKDTYDFQYGNFNDNRDYAIASSESESVTNFYNTGNQMDNNTSVRVNNSSTFFEDRKVLTKILHNGKVITQTSINDNYQNGPDSAITNISIYNNGNTTNGTSLSKSYHLSYSYFKTSPSIDITDPGKIKNVRLKLDKIDIRNNANQYVSDYEFDYISENSISRIGSRGQDYLGLYNGADGNSVLFSPSENYSSFGQTYGNRNPSFSRAIRGTLQKIKYPTGGHTIFEYEQATHRYREVNSVTNTEVKATLTNEATSLPPYNPSECSKNVHNSSTPITPKIASMDFEVEYLESGVHTIEYNKTSSGPPTLGTNAPQGLMIRKPDPSITYTWSDIYDSDCNLLINPANVVWSVDGSFSESTNVHLEYGHYQLVLALYSIHYDQSMEIRGPVAGFESNYIEEPKAGIRIKSITDYTDNNTAVKLKTYDYLLSTQLSRPIREYTTSERKLTPPNDGSSQNYMAVHRLAQPMNGESQHMVYSSVRENIVDPNDLDNKISSTYTFNTNSSTQGVHGKGNYQLVVTDAGGAFSPSHYSKHPGYGKLQSSTTLNNSTQKTYDKNFQIHSQTFGLSTVSIGRNIDKYPTIDYNSNANAYYIKMLSITPTSGIGGDGVAYTTPPECNNNPYCLRKIAMLRLYKTNYYGYQGGEVKSSLQITDSVQVLKGFTYTEGVKRYLKSETIASSDDEKVSTVYYYPHEPISDEEEEEVGGPISSFPTGPVASGVPRVPSLFSKNMLNQPVRVEQYHIDELLSSVETKYDIQARATEIVTSKGDNVEETRMTFDLYDSNKNLLQARQEDGAPVSFIWGYDDRYIVAKISNIQYESIPSSLINYIKSASNANNESLLLSRLNTLQNHSSLSRAHMTYYTYKPNIGVSTMTSESGKRMYYFYDNLQRLDRMEDHDGNVLSENDYNYKN